MKYLIIGSGGMGIYAYLGYLKSIEDTLDKVEEFSGASCGSILAVMLSLGFKPDEILDKLLSVDTKTLTKVNVKSLFKNYGFISHEPIKEVLKQILECDPIFSDLKRNVHIPSFCLNLNRTDYFSKESHPTMSVIDAICMSISVPVLFAAYKHNDMLYVDGATQEMYPFAPFLNKNPKEVLGIELEFGIDSNKSINNMIDFTRAMATTFMLARINPQIGFNLVKLPIGNVNIYDFSMSHDTTLKLYLKGML
jgi:NTE family protein